MSWFGRNITPFLKKLPLLGAIIPNSEAMNQNPLDYINNPFGNGSNSVGGNITNKAVDDYQKKLEAEQKKVSDALAEQARQIEAYKAYSKNWSLTDQEALNGYAEMLDQGLVLQADGGFKFSFSKLEKGMQTARDLGLMSSTPYSSVQLVAFALGAVAVIVGLMVLIKRYV